MKRVSAEWGAATLALGHPGHNGARRFRGSSMWRQLAAVEWHLADGLLTCEKSKIADHARLKAPVEVEYPDLRWLEPAEALSGAAGRDDLIGRDLDANPDDSQADRARRLAPLLGCGEEHARKLIRGVQRARNAP